MKSIIPISKFKSGETIQGFYLCVEKYLRHTRSGELYLDLVLKDKTGQINAKVWDNVKEYEKKQNFNTHMTKKNKFSFVKNWMSEIFFNNLRR